MLTFTTSFPYIVRGKTRQYSRQLRAYRRQIQSHTPGNILLYDFPALGLSAKYLSFPKTFSLRRDNNLPYGVVMRIKRRNLLKAFNTQFYTHAHTHPIAHLGHFCLCPRSLGRGSGQVERTREERKEKTQTVV